MLTETMLVLVDRNGRRRPVEALEIGDEVYDPLAKRHWEIADIWSREVRFSAPPAPSDLALRPIVMASESIQGRLPLAEVIVSPMQPILGISLAALANGTTHLELQTARRFSMTHGITLPFTKDKITYFALFTTEARYIDVAGLLLQSYDIASQNSYPPCRDEKSFCARPDYLSS